MWCWVLRGDNSSSIIAVNTLLNSIMLVLLLWIVLALEAENVLWYNFSSSTHIAEHYSVYIVYSTAPFLLSVLTLVELEGRKMQQQQE